MSFYNQLPYVTLCLIVTVYLTNSAMSAAMSASSSSISLPNSCINQDDGEQWIQLSQYNPLQMIPLHLTCSQQYVILDNNKDSNLEHYITDINDLYNDLSKAISSQDISQLQWEQWFIPCDLNHMTSHMTSPNNPNNEIINAKNIIAGISSDCTNCNVITKLDFELFSLNAKDANNYCVCYKPGPTNDYATYYQLTESQEQVLNDDYQAKIKEMENIGVEGEDTHEENGIEGLITKWLGSLRMRLAVIAFAVIFSSLLSCVCFRIHFGDLINLDGNDAKQINDDIDDEIDETTSETRILIGKYGSV